MWHCKHKVGAKYRTNWNNLAIYAYLWIHWHVVKPGKAIKNLPTPNFRQNWNEQFNVHELFSFLWCSTCLKFGFQPKCDVQECSKFSPVVMWLRLPFFSHFDFSRKTKNFKPFFAKNEKKPEKRSYLIGTYQFYSTASGRACPCLLGPTYLLNLFIYWACLPSEIRNFNLKYSNNYFYFNRRASEHRK